MGFRTPVSSDVINFRTVGPLAREDKGMVMSVTEGIDLQVDEKEKIEPYKKFSLEGMSWKDYVESNRESLEKQWAEEIKSELDRRKGKPVLVSVLDQEQGDSLQRKLGIAEENIQTYTDVHKPDEKMKKNGKYPRHLYS